MRLPLLTDVGWSKCPLAHQRVDGLLPSLTSLRYLSPFRWFVQQSWSRGIDSGVRRGCRNGDGWNEKRVGSSGRWHGRPGRHDHHLKRIRENGSLKHGAGVANYRVGWGR
jgi:hypothetical protein